jgi:protein TonB
MRLSVSLLVATLLHGVVFGVAAAVSSRPGMPRPAPPPVEIEVEVVAPKPDRIAEARPIPDPSPPTRVQTPAVQHRPRSATPAREVALVHDALPIDPTETVGPASPVGPAVPAAAPNAPAASTRAAIASGAGNLASATPRYRTNPPPEYPLPSRRRREEGIVLISVVVQANGLPAAISLGHTSGHPLLDRAALEAVRHWTFEPARAAGVPIPSKVVVPVRFSLSELP